MGFEPLDDLVDSLGYTLDLPAPQVNLLVCMFFTFPLGYINRFIYNTKARLIFGLVTGIILQYQMFGIEMMHVVLATLNTYLFIKFLGRKVTPFYVLIFNVIHLSSIHIKNMLHSYGKWKLGVESIYMMSICKFSSIAFNYEDGAKDESEIKSSYHREKLIKEKPTLLETFSYIFYFPSSLIGPSFEFKDFIKYIKLEGEYSNINYSVCTTAAFKELFQVFILLTIKLRLGKIFITQYCGTAEFVEHNLIYKYFYMVVAMLVMRSTYYAGFKLSQAAVNFSGLSYNKKINKDDTTEESSDKIDNCNLYEIELNLNPRIRIQYWNRTVHLWLKYYIFLRLINVPFKPFKNNKALASLVTFGVSAIWHGFYPVYFVFFFEYYMIEQVSAFFEEEYDIFNHIKQNWNFIPKFFFRVFLMSVVNYFGLAFSILTLESNYNYYRAFYYVPLAGLFFTWIYTKVAKRKPKEKTPQKTE